MKQTFPQKNIQIIAAGMVVLCLTFPPVVIGQSSGSSEKPAAAGKYPAFGLTQSEASLEQGRKVYQNYCIGCHGEKGDGQGPSAGFLNPKPRNFQTAEFRFQSTPSGDRPTDEDLYRTINEGLRGTSMPSWKLLSEDDKYAVIAYLKTFAPEKWADGPGTVTTITEDPYGSSGKEKAILRGEKVYHGMAQCYSCHASYISPSKINEARAEFKMPPLKAFRKNLETPQHLTTTDGSQIIAPDFTWNKLKRGQDLRTLYHVIGNGITGTPMPTWKGIFAEEDLWALVYYVQHLTSQRKALVTDEDLRIRRKAQEAFRADQAAYEAQQKKADELTKAAAAVPSAVPAETVKEPALG